MRKLLSVAGCLAIGCMALAGCHNKDDVANMTREQQVEAFKGDPVRGQQVGEEMKRRYGLVPGGRPTGAPQGTPQGGPPQGAPTGR